MAKYVCDFEQVKQLGEKICASSDEIKSFINVYSTNMDSDLNSWSGNAKNAFTTAKEKQVTTAQKDCTYIKELGEFIKQSAASIQELEEKIAGQTL